MRYRYPLHMHEWGYWWILYVEDEERNPIPGRTEGDLAVKNQFSHKSINIDRLTFFDDGSQSLTVIRILCDGFTKIPRLPCPIIYDEGQVMGCDSTSYCRSTGLYRFDGSPRCGMFKDDTKSWERMMKFK